MKKRKKMKIEGIEVCAAPACYRTLGPGQGKTTYVGDRPYKTCYSLGCLAYVQRLDQVERLES